MGVSMDNPGLYSVTICLCSYVVSLRESRNPTSLFSCCVPLDFSSAWLTAGTHGAHARGSMDGWMDEWVDGQGGRWTEASGWVSENDRKWEEVSSLY